MTHIQYTIQRNGVYYFNLKLPSNKIYRKSLKCDSAKVCRALVNSIIERIRKVSMDYITDQHLAAILTNIIDDELKLIISITEAFLRPKSWSATQMKDQYIRSTSNARHHNYHVSDCPYPITNKGKEILIPSYTEFLIEKISKSRNHSDYFREFNPEEEEYEFIIDSITPLTDPNMLRHDIDIELIKKQKKQLVSYLVSGDLESAEKLLRQILISQERISTNVQGDIFDQSRRLAKFPDLVEPYIEQLTIRSTSSTKRTLEFFNYFLHDTYVGSITRKILDEIVTIYSNTPKNQYHNKSGTNKVYPYKGLNLKERIAIATSGQEIPVEYLPSKSTISEVMSHLKLFFNYLVSEDYIERSPALETTLTADKVANYQGFKRFKFSSKHMKLMIPFLHEDEDINAVVTLIMAYTGARNSEVLQLRKDDIIQEEDSNIWCFNITQDAGSTKTQHSNRWIPIHSSILDKILKVKEESNTEYLFQLTNKDKLAKYYQHVRRQLNIPHLTQDKKLLDLYSLRHTVRSTLQILDIKERAIDAITGHAPKGSTGTTNYSHVDSDNMKTLKDAIEKISY